MNEKMGKEERDQDERKVWIIQPHSLELYFIKDHGRKLSVYFFSFSSTSHLIDLTDARDMKGQTGSREAFNQC